MNIFYLDEDIETCARYHVDAHVVKMILESAQILCSAAHLHGMNVPYRPTHLNHPCVIWAAYSKENWIWLKDMMMALNEEYQYRFEHEKPHKSVVSLQDLAKPPIPSFGLTIRPQGKRSVKYLLNFSFHFACLPFVRFTGAMHLTS